MRPQCTYFEVVEPFRFYRARGFSPSNSYFGSSRVINTVYDAVNAKPGMTFHALPGGLFAVEADGSGLPAALNAPKPVFEKTYLHYSNDERLLGLQKKGLVREIPAPAKKIDYNVMSKAADVKLPELMAEVYEVEKSPELQQFERDMEMAIEMLSAEASVVRTYDHTLDPTVGVRAEFAGGGRLRIDCCYIPGFYRVTGKNVPETSPFAILDSKDPYSKDAILNGLRVAGEARIQTPGR